MVARRDDIVGCWAARLAERAGRVVVEDTDYSEIAESDDEGPPGSSGRRHMVAPGRVRSVVVRAALSRGREVLKVEAAYKTMTCSACGRVEKFDAARNLVHACPTCAAVYDQDHNFCLNAFAASALVPRKSPEALAEAIRAKALGKGGMWRKRKTEKAERSAECSRTVS